VLHLQNMLGKRWSADSFYAVMHDDISSMHWVHAMPAIFQDSRIGVTSGSEQHM
jgi:hypothetical protein